MMNIEHEDRREDAMEREWQSQEQARSACRRGDAADGDARALRDRLIARELSRPLDAVLPSNFAYAQAQRIEAIAAERRRADARFVGRLKLGFALGYGGCIAVAAMVYHAELAAWSDAQAVAGVLANSWWPLLLGCAGLSYTLHARPWRKITSLR